MTKQRYFLFICGSFGVDVMDFDTLKEARAEEKRIKKLKPMEIGDEDTGMVGKIIKGVVLK